MTDDIDKLEEALGFLAHTFSRPKMWENLQRAANIEIDRPSAYLLHVLFVPHDGYTISELAKKLGVEAPSVTRAVQQMERNGLVKRVADPEDGRSYRILSTALGRKTMERVRLAKRQRLHAMVENWSPQDRHQLARLLHRLSSETSQIIKKSSAKETK